MVRPIKSGIMGLFMLRVIFAENVIENLMLIIKVASLVIQSLNQNNGLIRIEIKKMRNGT